MDCFLYDKGLRHERVNAVTPQWLSAVKILVNTVLVKCYRLLKSLDLMFLVSSVAVKLASNQTTHQK